MNHYNITIQLSNGVSYIRTIGASNAAMALEIAKRIAQSEGKSVVNVSVLR